LVCVGEVLSEFRYCKQNRKWILFAPNRLKRPYDFKSDEIESDIKNCPFEVGNEHLTPKEIYRISDEQGWKCRVVPNLYNALFIEKEPLSHRDGYFEKYEGFGAHEGIIETPNHKKMMYQYSASEFNYYLLTIQNRLKELKKDIRKEEIKNPYIYLPSGTGTTALFLQKNLPFRVFTCSTVGNDEYLKEQFEEIGKDNFPAILSSQKKYHYGKLYRELYELWLELKKDMGITFDLMYDPVGWQKFLLHIDEIEGTPIYIHQGGVIGNGAMLERYKRKYETN